MSVFNGLTITGTINTPHDTLLANVRSAIRRGHPQIWPTTKNYDRIALVCGGPSLESTIKELREAVFAGAKVVTVNGSYHWAIEHNFHPSAQIVLDARPFNARFLHPEVPNCRYYLCSHCAPEVWDAVEGRPYVGIWHDASTDEIKAELDTYYLGQWHSIPGGTTVGTRAIGLLRTLGFLRFDIFGLDSCYMDNTHHAYPQPENDADKPVTVTVAPADHPERKRSFVCAPWMVKQAEDFVAFVRTNGDKFLLNIHGDGLIAYLLSSQVDTETSVEPAVEEIN